MTRYRVYFRINSSYFSSPGLIARDIQNTHVPITYIDADDLMQVFGRMSPGQWAPEEEARELLRSKNCTPRYLGLEPGDVVQEVDRDKYYQLRLDGIFEELMP